MSTAGLHYLPMAEYARNPGPGPYCADDYLALPEGERVELIEGNLIVSPAPNSRHQVVALLLSDILLKAARKGRGVGLASPIDVVLGTTTVVQPDLIYVARARRSIIKQRVNGPPDLAIEILSRSDPDRDRTHKLALYAEHGIREYWIVDAAAQHIDFLHLAEGRYQVHPERGKVYTSPFLPEVSIDLPAFWAEVSEMLAD